MVEATQTQYNPAYDTTTTANTGLKGKLASLKSKLGGHPATTDSTLGTSGVQPTSYGTTQPSTLGGQNLGGQTYGGQPLAGQTIGGQPLAGQQLGTQQGFGSQQSYGGQQLTGQTLGSQPLLTQQQQHPGLGGTSGFNQSFAQQPLLSSSSTTLPGATASSLPQSGRSSISSTSEQQFLSSGIQSSEIIQEKPVLDRVEKIIQKEVVQKPRIQEQIRQDIIEVHEKPIEKRFMHPVQEFRVQDQTQFEIQGKEAADFERQNLLNRLREQDRLHQVTVDQRQDVKMFQEAPLMSQTKEMRKEVIYKPIVTEIHEQPIREIHEQAIQRTIYEKPIVTVIRDQSIIENISSGQPLTGINYQATPLMQQQPILTRPVPVPVVVQQAPLAQSVIIEKGATENLPHVVGTGVNAAEVDAYENKSFLRK